MTHPAPDTPADEPLTCCLRVADAGVLPHVRATLEGAGIPHLVKGEGVQNLFGFGSAGLGHSLVTGPPIVLVPEARFEEACTLLAEFAEALRAPAHGAEDEPDGLEDDEDGEDAQDDAPPPAPPAGRCAACGKDLEAGLPGDEPADACWHCGAELPRPPSP